MTMLVLVFKKIESDDKNKAETITNESDIDNVFKSIYTTVIKNIRNSSLNDSGWIIDLVIDHKV